MIKEGIVTVLLTTSLGEIKIELNKELAPITTQNFVKYVESGFYDQTIFHRVIENFVIQGGGHNEDMSMKDRDLEILNAIKPKLIKTGILVAGIDILGSFLTEINITSPTCLRELYDQQGINLAKDLIEQIEKAF